jgi:hypothetical protein
VLCLLEIKPVEEKMDIGISLTDAWIVTIKTLSRHATSAVKTPRSAPGRGAIDLAPAATAVTIILLTQDAGFRFLVQPLLHGRRRWLAAMLDIVTPRLQVGKNSYTKDTSRILRKETEEEGKRMAPSLPPVLLTID